MVDATAPSLEVTVAGRDLCIKQSPGLLFSDRTGGTTGAVMWQITQHFANWLASKNNVLFRVGMLNQNSTVVELGTGVSGVVALTLGPRVREYIATDQRYTLKLLERNISDNSHSKSSKAGSAKTDSKSTSKRSSNIQTVALDWEIDDASSLFNLLKASSNQSASQSGVDVVIACDCIYNEALIEPFVRACTDICSLRGRGQAEPTVCVIAQQLRSAEVFEIWLRSFARSFSIWRVPDELLSDGLKPGTGFVVHVGILQTL